MLCEICKKRKASVFYNETIGGKTRTSSLCSECAADLKKGNALEDISSVLREWGIAEAQADTLFGNTFRLPTPKGISPVRTCPSCGLTLGDIAAAGRVGCATCYKTFGNELNTALSLLHGNAHHIGQCPVRYRERLQRAERIQALRERLREAVASEGYEEAVALRDEIRNLEKEDQ